MSYGIILTASKHSVSKYFHYDSLTNDNIPDSTIELNETSKSFGKSTLLFRDFLFQSGFIIPFSAKFFIHLNSSLAIKTDGKYKANFGIGLTYQLSKKKGKDRTENVPSE